MFLAYFGPKFKYIGRKTLRVCLRKNVILPAPHFGCVCVGPNYTEENVGLSVCEKSQISIHYQSRLNFLAHSIALAALVTQKKK